MFKQTKIEVPIKLEREKKIGLWSKKQKRSFNAIKTGLNLARRENKNVRFLTLTTSDIQSQEVGYDERQLNGHHRKFKQRVQRMTPAKMVKDGYIKAKDLRKYYPELKPGQNLSYDYFKIQTNEGNGVIHSLFKGNYLPYNYVVDNWNDLHNSWDVNIKAVKNGKESVQKVSSYVVSQYLSTQKSSYVRSSQCWHWLFRGYRKAWLNHLAQYMRDYTKQYKDFYGGWHAPYKDEKDINWKDIISKWDDRVYRIVHGRIKDFNKPLFQLFID